jgi:hypothetical protein
LIQGAQFAAPELPSRGACGAFVQPTIGIAMKPITSSDQRRKFQLRRPVHAIDRATDSDRVPAGRDAYREEFQPDYGPDQDEALDRTESGREF